MRRVETYRELDEELDAWIDAPPIDGRIAHIALVGDGGCGKSQRLKRLLGKGRFHDFGGANSPSKMFEDLTDDPTLPVVFDDMHSVLRSVATMDLVKQICDTDATRRVNWNKSNKPVTSIVISGKVCLILNQLPKPNKDILAIEDRFDVINFVPLPSEMMMESKKIFPKKYHADINFIYSLNINFSFRAIIRFVHWRESRGKEIAVQNLNAEFGIKEDVLVMASIIEHHHPKFWTDKFCELTGRERKAATKYWNAHKLEASQLLVARGIVLDAEKLKGIKSLRAA